MRLLLAAFGMALLVYVGSMGVMSAVWTASAAVKVSRAVEMSVMALCLVAAIAAADTLVARGLPRVATYALAVVLAGVVGAALGWQVREWSGVSYPQQATWVSSPGLRLLHKVDTALIGSVMAGLATLVHVHRRTALAARRRQHAAEQARVRAQRRTLESQLQALQARVEPMFLFGTLERIRTLYRSEPAAAGAMLEHLIDYLRAALPHLRESTAAVPQELTLVRAWLEIVAPPSQGWRWEVQADPALDDARLPALVLLPLVQCAVTAGGAGPRSLSLSLRSAGEHLQVTLDCVGDAFARDDAAAVLAPIRERLQALHGEHASLEAGARSDGQPGSRARMRLPLERGAAPDIPLAGAAA
jgi:hypothetical protein